MRYFFLVVFICIYHPIKSQAYIPTVQDSSNWIVYFSDEDFTETNYWGIHLNGDTIVEGLQYKKVYSFGVGLDDNNNWEVTHGQLHYPVAIMREDTIQRKVFGRLFQDYVFISSDCSFEYLNNGTGDQLMFDYNLEIGDTLHVCHEEVDNPLIVSDFSNQFMFNEERRVWDFSSGYLIEGVGSDVGPFGSFRDFFHAGWGYGLQYYYKGALSDISQFSTSGVENSLRDEYILYPNPVSSYLHLGQDSKIKEYQIFDMYGRILESGNSQGDPIDVRLLANGQYFICFSAGGVKHREIFIKN